MFKINRTKHILASCNCPTSINCTPSQDVYNDTPGKAYDDIASRNGDFNHKTAWHLYLQRPCFVSLAENHRQRSDNHFRLNAIQHRQATLLSSAFYLYVISSLFGVLSKTVEIHLNILQLEDLQTRTSANTPTILINPISSASRWK